LSIFLYFLDDSTLFNFMINFENVVAATLDIFT